MYFASSRLIAWKLGTHTFCNISPDIFVIFDHEVKIKNANGNFWKSKKFQKHKQFSKYEKITKMKNNPQKQKIQKYIKYKQIGQTTKKYHDLKLWSGPGSKITYLKSVEVFWNGGCVFQPGRPVWPGYYGPRSEVGGLPQTNITSLTSWNTQPTWFISEYQFLLSGAQLIWNFWFCKGSAVINGGQISTDVWFSFKNIQIMNVSQARRRNMLLPARQKTHSDAWLHTNGRILYFIVYDVHNNVLGSVIYEI